MSATEVSKQKLTDLEPIGFGRVKTWVAHLLSLTGALLVFAGFGTYLNQAYGIDFLNVYLLPLNLAIGLELYLGFMFLYHAQKHESWTRPRLYGLLLYSPILVLLLGYFVLRSIYPVDPFSESGDPLFALGLFSFFFGLGVVIVAPNVMKSYRRRMAFYGIDIAALEQQQSANKG